MPNRKRTARTFSAADAQALKNATRYIAKLKIWLRKEKKWQVLVRRYLYTHDRGGPGLPPSPPPPPFKP